MSLTERKHPMAECENCTLKDEPYAPTVGPSEARIVIVGEKPGHKEARSGEPFTGPSGQLLDGVLQHHGIDRKNTLVTNVCLCRTPENRPPSKAEIKCCAERLKADLSKAETIIALGNTAATSVMGHSTKITQLRVGPPKRSELYPNATIIPTFHPAACLRASDNFPSLVADIGKIAGGSTVGFKVPAYAVYPSVSGARSALTELLQRFNTFTVDIETAYDKDASYEPSFLIDPLCIGIGYAPNKAIVLPANVLSDWKVCDLLRSLLSDKRVICHNGKYDLAWLMRIAPNARLYFDTMLASYALDERAGVHGLKYLAVEILGAPRYDQELEGKKWTEIAPDVLYKYNAYDCAATFQLYEYYTKQMDAEGVRPVHDFLVSASNELMHMERQGVAIDVEFLEQLEEKFHRELQEAEALLRPWVANPRSPKQVMEALTTLGYKVGSTNKDTMIELVSKELGIPTNTHYDDLMDELPGMPHTAKSEFLWRMLSHRKESKLYGTYIKGTRKRLYGGRLYPTFLLHGTTTGRLSCRNPNVQNIPRGSSIRNLFVPSDGNVFVQGDYAQAELRTIATLARDTYLQGVFSQGRDIHGEVAASFYGSNFTKEQRVKAKMVVFGLSYDMSAYGLAWRMGISEKEAERFLDTFFSVIPDVALWRKDVERQIFEEQEDLISPFIGNHRRFWLITKENKNDIRREGLAFYPQNIASNICLRSFVRLRPMLAGVADFRITVHDSLLAECKSEDKEDVARTMNSVMEETALEFDDFVPFKVDIGTGTQWGNLG